MAGRQGEQERRKELQQPQALRVRSYICQPTATIIIWLPVDPARRAVQNWR